MVPVKLALQGPLTSGKSSVARELVEHGGLTLVNFTDLLKRLYAEAKGFDLAAVIEHKEAHREHLIRYGHEIGFDDDPQYVTLAVKEAGNPDRAVFDNVRYPAQMDALHELGYTLVRLYVPRELALLRLVVYKGLTLEQAKQRADDATEHAMDDGYWPGEIEVGNYDRTPLETAGQILAQADAPFPRPPVRSWPSGTAA